MPQAVVSVVTHSEGFVFTETHSKRILKLYNDGIKNLGPDGEYRYKRDIYKMIAKTLNEEFGTDFNTIQIDNKIKKLANVGRIKTKYRYSVQVANDNEEEDDDESEEKHTPRKKPKTEGGGSDPLQGYVDALEEDDPDYAVVEELLYEEMEMENDEFEQQYDSSSMHKTPKVEIQKNPNNLPVKVKTQQFTPVRRKPEEARHPPPPAATPPQQLDRVQEMQENNTSVLSKVAQEEELNKKKRFEAKMKMKERWHREKMSLMYRSMEMKRQKNELIAELIKVLKSNKSDEVAATAATMSNIL